MNKLLSCPFTLAERLFPIHRSITGNGTRETLSVISEIIPINIYEIPTGKNIYDWTIPEEWSIGDAFIENSSGDRIIDISNSNLHVIGYSDSVDKTIALDELKKHIFSIEEHPDWIPYITSYYAKNWGFCMTHRDLLAMDDDNYYVKIDSFFKNGSLTYGDLVIPGQTKEEIMISVNICHPSMANNELSGLSVATYLAKYILDGSNRRYTYRFVFVPETIGAIAYIHANKDKLKENVVAGYVLTCIGDSGNFSYLNSMYANTITDRMTLHILKYSEESYSLYDYSERGSDERQYCYPGIDLPIGSLMRTMYDKYPEYHTSADNMDFISRESLNESLEKIKLCVDMLDQNKTYKVTVLCEPQLGKRNLYPTISTKDSINIVRDFRNVLVYCNGQNSVLDIAEILNKPIWKIIESIDMLVLNNLIVEVI